MRFDARTGFVARLAAGLAALGLPAATASAVTAAPAETAIPAEASAAYAARPRAGQILACGTAGRPAEPGARRAGAAGAGASPIHGRPLRLVVEPLPFGPRLREQTRDDGPLTPDAASRIVAGAAEQLRSCYRWARQSAPELETSLEVALHVDEWGGIASVEAEPGTPRAARLAQCVRDQLAGLAFGRSVGHPAIVHHTIRFHRTGLGAPRGMARPRASAPLPPPPRLCVSATQIFPEMLHLPEMTVDDEEPAQRAVEECEKARRKAKEADDEWRRRHPHVPARSSTPSCPGAAISLSPPEVAISPDAAADYVVSRLSANLGALRSCFRSVLQRSAGVEGTLTFDLTWDRRGFVQTARAASTEPEDVIRRKPAGARGEGGVAEARECVEDALRSVWLEPLGRPLEVTVTLVLSPGAFGPKSVSAQKDTPAGLEQRARQALAAGDAELALRHYSSLLEHLPGDERRCDWLVGALEATEQAEPWLGERTMQALDALAVEVSKRGATPATAACVERGIAPIARPAVTEHMHGEGLKQSRSLQLANERYRKILEVFAGSPGIEELRHRYAQALWATEDFCSAAAAYDDVVTRSLAQARPPQIDRLRDGLSGAVLAWKNCLFTEQLVAGQGDPEDTATVAERSRRMHAAFRRYLEHGDATARAQRALPLGIEEDSQAGYCEKVAALVKTAVETRSAPDGTLIGVASGFFDCLVVSDRTSEGLDWVTKILAIPELTGEEAVWREMLAWKSELHGRVLAKAGQFQECGWLMQAAADATAEKGTWQHADRLWLAGRCFQRAGLAGRALEANLQLINDHLKDGAPSSEQGLAKEAVARVAAGYKSVGDLTRAAAYYEVHSREQASALAAAVALRVELADAERAAADVSLFVNLYSRAQPESAAALFFKLGEVYEQKKQLDVLAKHLATYLREWGQEGGPDRQILAHFRLGELLWQRTHPSSDLTATMEGNRRVRWAATRRAAEEHFETAIRLWVRGGVVEKVGGADAEARLAAAEAAVAGATFYLADAAAHDFIGATLPARKAMFLDRARARYLVALSYNLAPWAIAAAARIGQLYLQQSDMQTRAARQQPGDGAGIIETRAISSFEKCLDLATEHSAHGDWSRLCERELHQLRPSKYPLPAEIGPDPAAPSPTVTPSPILPIRNQ